MDKETIRRNFSRYAYSYDKYADVQRKVAFELLGQIKEGAFNKILELGCGTGNYTHLLKDRFKDAKIRALDLSDTMIEVASNKLRNSHIEFMAADAETLNLEEEFDLITSNACFQWFENIEKALLGYKRLLKKNGIILFSVFGPRTFWELGVLLRSVLQGRYLTAATFMPMHKLEKILSEHFETQVISEIKYEESFVSLKGLLDKIKYLGLRGNGLDNKFSFSRKTLQKIEEGYLNKFHKIKATYQVFLCHARMKQEEYLLQAQIPQ